MTRLIGLNALMVALGVAVFGVVMAPLGIRQKRDDFVRATAVITLDALLRPPVAAVVLPDALTLIQAGVLAETMALLLQLSAGGC